MTDEKPSWEWRAQAERLELQLAETLAHLEAQRQATYRAVAREHAAKRQLAEITMVGKSEAIALLRRQHAAYVRLVKRLRHAGKVRTAYQSNREAKCAVISAYTLACDDFLAAMARYKGVR